jgi:histidinol-phosphate/aromatic aminotransferase/cobyric acid decarboxylase-like protein
LELQGLLAEREGLDLDYVHLYAGSSVPLQQAVLAFCSPSRPFVTADPGFETGERIAHFIGARVFRTPLTSSFAHDVRAMVAAKPNAGIMYVCNPNNPTGTLTPRSDIEWLLEHKPKESILLLDEAYIHISGAPAGSDLVAMGHDVIILRTFSKIYGMAGLRVGAAFGRPDLLQKIRSFGTSALPITGVAAAIASLKCESLVQERRKIIGDIRADVLGFLHRRGFNYVPSVSSKFMVDVRRPGQQVVEALQEEKVYIGRIWPSWPTHVRVSIGTHDDMEKFKAAFLSVMHGGRAGHR